MGGLGPVARPEPETLAHAMNWVYGVNVIFAVAALMVTIPLILQARRQIAEKLAAE
jgi:hypothetical protein